MKITIEFSTDNAAFEDGWLMVEVEQVVDRIYAKIYDNRHNPMDWSEKLMDSNGNTIGTVRGELDG